MTCIVGLTDGQRVWIGGDSAATSGWELTVRADQKVFRTGPMVMGFTSSYRMGQLLRYSFTPPARTEKQAVEEYMATVFVNAVRTVLSEGGWTKKNNEREEGGYFLVGYEGQLFQVESDFQVAECLDKYDATGSGAAVALGALYASPRLKPKPRILQALAAAERWNAGVRRPFIVRSVGRA